MTGGAPGCISWWHRPCPTGMQSSGLRHIEIMHEYSCEACLEYALDLSVLRCKPRTEWHATLPMSRPPMMLSSLHLCRCTCM
jgi:hypothetical protein